MISIMLVDDHELVRDGLQRILERTSDLEVVGSVASGSEAIRVDAVLRADVILMDVSMPGMSGIEATERIRSARTDANIVMLTATADGEDVVAALDAGASGYLLKDAETASLLTGVREAANGDVPLDSRAARALVDHRRERDRPTLTRREEQVLELVRDGLTNKAIAKELGISEKTVKTHLTKIFTTLGVVGRTQAALWAQRNLLRAA